MATFFHPLKAQARVVGALILREMRTRFGKSRIGYAWALIDPLLYVAVLSAVFYAAGRNHPPLGTSMILFFASGVIPYRMCMKISSSMLAAIRSNEALLYFPVVKQIDTLLSRFILEFFTYFLVLTIIFSFFVAFFHLPLPNIPHLLGAVISLGMLGMGVGIINAVLAGMIKSWDKIFSVISTPLFFASGILYLVDRLPQKVREMLSWNPILHGVEWFREGIYPGFTSYTLDQTYLIKWGVVTLLLGLALERSLRRHLRKTI